MLRKLSRSLDLSSLFKRSIVISMSLFLGLGVSVFLIAGLSEVSATAPNPILYEEPDRLQENSSYTLTVGTQVPYEPFEYYSGTEIIGFDIDLMDAIAVEMGAEAKYITVEWETKFEELRAGNHDAVISALSILPEREEVIDFTLPYLDPGEGPDIGIAVRQGDVEQRRMINEALWQLREDGTLETIRAGLQAWFDINNPGVEVFLPSWPAVYTDTQTTLTYTDTLGTVTAVQIPAGALSETVMITYTPTDTSTVPSNFRIIGQAFDLDAYHEGTFITDTFTFIRPVTITVSYAITDVIGVDENEIILEYWNESTGKWEDAACGPYDRHPGDNWLAVPICHLSRFVFVEEHYFIHLPISVGQ